jgi:Histidine kinase-, DNA gyrase B-, and HSP90-like ATPase
MIVLLRSEANRYSISIDTELAEDLPKVMADRVQLQQVLMNLMLNGIDAMKEAIGGGQVTIKSEACDAQLLISVSDTGVGLPQEQGKRSSRHSLRPKIRGLVWGCPSVGQSSSRMAVACGPPALPEVVQLFNSPCPPRPRRMHNLLSCYKMVANRRFPFGLSHTVCTH